MLVRQITIYQIIEFLVVRDKAAHIDVHLEFGVLDTKRVIYNTKPHSLYSDDPYTTPWSPNRVLTFTDSTLHASISFYLDFSSPQTTDAVGGSGFLVTIPSASILSCLPLNIPSHTFSWVGCARALSSGEHKNTHFALEQPVRTNAMTILK